MRRRRGFALLALVAAAAPQPIGREKLLGFLWPESESERARNSLRQTMYSLRRELGEDIFLPESTGGIQLDPARVAVDLWEFRAAMARKAPADAVAAYRGPFLDGFAVPGLPELSQWVESERQRLERQYVDALDALAREATAAGRHAEAASWRRRQAAADPLSALVALALIKALADAGDRAGALQYAGTYERLVREQLDTQADPAVRKLAESLRRAPPVPTGADVAVDSPRTTPAETLTGAETDAAAGDSGRIAAVAPDRVGRGARGARLAAGLAAVVLVLAGFGWQAMTRRTSAEARVGTLTAVLPFTARGTADIAYLREGLADILADRLDGVAELRMVDPNVLIGYLATARPAPPLELGQAAARHFAANYFVLGNVTEAGNQLEISASLYDAGGRLRARASAATTEPELLGAVDKIARELLAGQVGGPSADLLREATVTTSSLPALKAYLEGEHAYRGNRMADMRVAMERAVAEDSTFALAHYRLAIAAEASGGGLQQINRAVENAVRYRDRLSNRHRHLLDALHAYWRGNYGNAQEEYRRAVLRYPDDLEAWYRLAELQFHRMPAVGQPFTEARGSFERVLALEPGNEGALQHLARIAAVEGRAGELDSLTARALVSAEPMQAIELRLIRAFAVGDSAERARAAAASDSLPLDALHVAAMRVASYTDEVRAAEALIARLTAPGNPRMTRVQAQVQLADFAAAGGRWREARRRLQEVERMAPVPALAMEASFGILPFVPMTRAEVVRLRERVANWRMASAGTDSLTGLLRVPARARPALRRFYLAALSLRLGDATDAARQAVELGRDSVAVSLGFPTLLRAMVALNAGHPAQGLAALDSLTAGDATLGFVRQEPLMRYARGQLLQSLGRDGEADGWLGSYGDLAGWDLGFLAPGELARARGAGRRGDTRAAIRHYERALKLWTSADAELQPLVDEARKELAGLTSVVR